MLSVNKKFLNEEYYQRIIERKYPELIQFKNKDIKTCRERKIVYLNYNLNWRNFYIKNVYYMLKIQDIYKIPYFACKKLIPERILYQMNRANTPHSWALTKALQQGNVEIINLIVGKNLADISSSSLTSAVKSGNFPLIRVIYFHRLHKNLKYPLFYAIYKNRRDIVDFLTEYETPSIEDWNYCLLRICTSSNLDSIKYIISKGANNISECIELINSKIDLYRDRINLNYLSHLTDVLHYFRNFTGKSYI